MSGPVWGRVSAGSTVYSPGRPLPLCGACDVVQVLDPPGRRPPLLPAASGEQTRLSSHRTSEQRSVPVPHPTTRIPKYHIPYAPEGSVHCLRIATVSQKRKEKKRKKISPQILLTHRGDRCQTADCSRPQGLRSLSGPWTAGSLQQHMADRCTHGITRQQITVQALTFHQST